MGPLRALDAAIREAASLQGVSAVALLFIPGRGWLCTDQVHLDQARSDKGALHVQVLADGDWVRPEIAGAVEQLHAARFIDGTAVMRLSSRPNGSVATEGSTASSGRFS